jgi:hypothetical protein
MRDWEQCLKEVQKYYSFGETAHEDMAYLKERYRQMRELLIKDQGGQSSS